MANILYYSVHESLEYDEVSLLTEMGHIVFSLGAYCPDCQRPNPFRPALTVNANLHPLLEIFRATGCRSVFTSVAGTVVTNEFLDLFDVIIVMHDIYFIAKNWHLLRGRQVVWRTIGQAINDFDRLAAPYRSQGMQIVRWSSRETLIDEYIGHDAIIRGHKDAALQGEWRGRFSDVFVTFSSAYRQRYLSEYDFLQRSVQGLQYKVGGGSNEGVLNSTGLISFSDQRALLQESFCYLYFHGSEIPYTLNFAEAWITGIPVVVIDKAANIEGLDFRYNEIDDMIVDNQNGFKVATTDQANTLLKRLLQRRELAAEVGRCGRITAISIFGKQRARQDWSHFLDGLSC